MTIAQEQAEWLARHEARRAQHGRKPEAQQPKPQVMLGRGKRRPPAASGRFQILTLNGWATLTPEQELRLRSRSVPAILGVPMRRLSQ